MTETDSHRDVLVSTEWVARHGLDTGVRLIEVDVDTSAYERGHIPGAIGFDWQTQLQDAVRRDILNRAAFERLLGDSGVDRDTTVVFYGDNSNWFAAYGFWLMSLYGHQNLRIMNGGRLKWIQEGRKLTAEVPAHEPKDYRASVPDPKLRAMRSQVEATLGRNHRVLVDVRSFEEYAGRILAPPGLMETAQRGGHIPGAKNLPWSRAARADGTFKPVEELRALYAAEGITEDKEIITYCRIGERSSHTWFVLKHLLGYPRVLNYDGSWTEWGSMIGTPIER